MTTRRPSTIAVPAPHSGHIMGIPGDTVRDRAKNFCIPGTIADHPSGLDNEWYGKGAAFNGRRFEAVKVDANDSGPYFYFRWLGETPFEALMVFYYPVDPRIIEADVQGATRAYPNADNTAWLFAHTEEGTHHDYELRLLAACDGVFQPFFRQLTVDSFSSVDTARSLAQRRFTLLSEFYGAVVVKARAAARQIFLGEREQSPHPTEGWLDRDITAAVAAVKADWAAANPSRSPDLSVLSSAIGYVENSLKMPKVETRWDRAARLAAAEDDDNA